MTNTSLPATLILASSSKYRRMLLQRFGLPFRCEKPNTDETAAAGEKPADLVTRLAVEKAAVVAANHPRAVVIGSDQVAVFNDRIVGKPGNHKTAFSQLETFSGQHVDFLTAVSVQRIQGGFARTYTDCTSVYFRALEHGEIERYLLQEKTYDCVGAFKAESLGISLFERVVSEDPTALIGLPLIRTARMLREAGLQLP